MTSPHPIPPLLTPPRRTPLITQGPAIRTEEVSFTPVPEDLLEA